MTKFFPNLVNNSWLWRIMRKKGGNILNEKYIKIFNNYFTGIETTKGWSIPERSRSQQLPELK